MKHGGVVDRVTRLLPYGTKSAIGYQYKKYMYASYLKRRFGDRYQPVDPGPLAPPALIETEALMFEGDIKVRRGPKWYFGSGCREAWTVLTMAEQYGADVTKMRSVLEFGCGSARVLRHFRDIAGLHLAGTDANPKPMEWDRRNVPGIEFSNNELTPPLPYPDDSFDLIYALSVFTHIPLEWQRVWLDELRRVMRPGGFLLCTVVGDSFFRIQLTAEERAELARTGELTKTADSPGVSYSSQVLHSWDVFQTRDRVREVFSQGFEMRCYTTEGAAAGQDTLILRKPYTA